jgi:hypothetical protein
MVSRPPQGSSNVPPVAVTTWGRLSERQLMRRGWLACERRRERHLALCFVVVEQPRGLKEHGH